MKSEFLYFIKKGVFSKEEAKQILKERENNGFLFKKEYSLTKKNVKLSDYLKSI
jgi:hypothetical protein